jgi:hypothetical protein
MSKENGLSEALNEVLAVVCALVAVCFFAGDGMLVQRFRHYPVHSNLGGEYLAASLLAVIAVAFVVGAVLFWRQVRLFRRDKLILVSGTIKMPTSLRFHA